MVGQEKSMSCLDTVKTQLVGQERRNAWEWNDEARRVAQKQEKDISVTAGSVCAVTTHQAIFLLNREFRPALSGLHVVIGQPLGYRIRLICDDHVRRLHINCLWAAPTKAARPLAAWRVSCCTPPTSAVVAAGAVKAFARGAPAHHLLQSLSRCRVPV